MYRRIFMKLKRLAVDNIHVHIKRIKLIEYVLCISIFQRHLCIIRLLVEELVSCWNLPMNLL